MFQELQHLIEKQVVYSIFKVGVATHAAPSLLQRRGVALSAPAKTMGDGELGIRNQESGIGQSADPKVGRNDPCFCGSGRKYKKCHGI